MDGSYIGRDRVANYLRQEAEDDTGQLDAVTTWEESADAFIASKPTIHESFSLYKVEIENMPHMIATDEPFDDWQVTLFVSFSKS